MAGVYLFYVQHQFEDVYWEHSDRWSYDDAALEGSSYFKLPKLLQFFTGNIGLHHVHHLNARVPNYNLQAAHDENEVFASVPVLTIRESLRCPRLKLIDSDTGRLLTWPRPAPWFRRPRRRRRQSAPKPHSASAGVRQQPLLLGGELVLAEDVRVAQLREPLELGEAFVAARLRTARAVLGPRGLRLLAALAHVRGDRLSDPGGGLARHPIRELAGDLPAQELGADEDEDDQQQGGGEAMGARGGIPPEEEYQEGGGGAVGEASLAIPGRDPVADPRREPGRAASQAAITIRIP